jgi:hypothetical protein
VAEAAHPADALAADVGREHRTEPIPPKPHCLVAQVNAALEQEVLDVAQRQRKPDVHENDEADHLGRGVEAAERAGR